LPFSASKTAAPRTGFFAWLVTIIWSRPHEAANARPSLRVFIPILPISGTGLAQPQTGSLRDTARRYGDAGHADDDC
jgi:hypothetical protein